MKKNILLLATIWTCFQLSVTAQTHTLRLSELDLTALHQPYGKPGKDRSVDGNPLVVAGETFRHGIGVLSGSRFKLSLQKQSKTLSCRIGISDHPQQYPVDRIALIPMTDGTMVFYRTSDTLRQKQFVGIGNGDGSQAVGSVVFKITGDGKELYNSGTITGGEKSRPLTLDVSNIDILELTVEDNGDGQSGDHAAWLDATVTYDQKAPVAIALDQDIEPEPMPEQTARLLQEKISALPTVALPLPKPDYDWLIEASPAVSGVYQTHEGKDIVLSNGLISRVFRIFPNLATIDIVHQTTGENLLRAVSNEGTLTVDGTTYTLGGLDGQQEFGYIQYPWIDRLTTIPRSFRIVDFEIAELAPRIRWANKRWSLEKGWTTTGKVLSFYLEGPDYLKGLRVKLNYALYDGMPCISKWFEIENNTGMAVSLNEFTLEQLAMAEPESPVEAKDPHQFLKPNIHVESDWGFLGFTEREADKTEHWSTDPRYKSQCNYPLLTPCLLEVKLPMGPDEEIAAGGSFESFRTWLMPFDSYDRDRKGLALKRMYRKIAPWTTENPIFLHCTSSDPQVVRTAIDQCAETGYEMVILSFGSGLNLEDESEANVARIKEMVDYARSKGIELGGYSLLSSRWISDAVDVINPETGKRGGMIFGSSPCLCSDWGYEYFRKIKNIFERTGMTVFENDGSYPGNVCASTSHTYHKGLKDSQWKQRKKIADLYRWMCENGIYTNIPDYGYMLNGGTKVGIGYREVNWSLPRERQLVLGRQVIYDGLWERLPGMCWTFVPLTQYHGGGAAATLEPLSEHLDAYEGHMMQNYGSGVQACYRGHRLYDTDETKQLVRKTIDWYKKYRDILNSEVLHLRRPDGRDYDGILHVNPALKEKGLAMLYNPTSETIVRDITLPLYYTGLTKKARISERDGKSRTYRLDRNYNVTIRVTIAPHAYTWFVIE